MTNGLIQLPRSIEQQAWYRRALDRTVAIHLLLNASFKALSHPIYGVLERGSYVTTYRQLAEDLGLKNSTCEKIIKRLKADGFLCVKQLNRATQIVITWRDFTTLRDEGVLPDQSEVCTNLRTKSCTNLRTKSCTNQTDVKYCNNESCEGEESRACTKSCTNLRTKSCTTSCTLKNNVIEESNIIHTQEYYNPGITKSAGAGAREAHGYAHTDERVQDVIALITAIAPEAFEMKESFKVEDLRKMADLSHSDLERILLVCSSKEAFLKSNHSNPYAVFRSYADNDFALLRQMQSTTADLLTYAEYCDACYRGEGKQYQCITTSDGRKMWQRVN